MAEFDGGDGLEFNGSVALGFDYELAVSHVETERRVRLDGVGVLAGEGFKRGSGGCGGLDWRCGLGLRQGLGKGGCGGKQSKAESGESETQTKQEGPPQSLFKKLSGNRSEEHTSE